MNKFYFLVLMLFASFSASAGVVPMTRAKAEAERFMKDAAPARSPQLRLMFESPRMTKAGLTDPEYFIFEDVRGGYVIAAGDDAVPPVLGYSTSGSFRTEEMPENLRSWLDMWSDIVDDARLRNAAPYAAPYSAATKSIGRAKLLKTALWGQSAPYNNHCIVVDGKRSVTGCVATSTAILMRYHKWPEKGKGKIPSYSFEDAKGNSHTVSAISLGHPYDWDNMPLYDPSEEKWTDDQKEEVAVLMQELGVMLQNNYSPTGTSAHTPDVIPGLAKYMDYDAGAVFEKKSMYASVEDWLARIIKNIDEVGPVQYSAQSPEGGHAFILDGYDENGFVHINWGWSGSGNGYYVMPAFDDYTEEHGATFGLKKNAGGVVQEMIQLYQSGVSCSVTEFATGTPFELSCQGVLNVGTTTFDGEVAFVRVDRFGRMMEQVSAAFPLNLDPNYYYVELVLPCEIKEPIQAGDRVQLMFRSPKTPSWKAVRSDYEAGYLASVCVGDVPVETITSLAYNPAAGILTVSFSDEASCELRRGSSVIRDGVSEAGRDVQIDANQLAPSTYTLRLMRGGQVKDIAIKFGLKK